MQTLKSDPLTYGSYLSETHLQHSSLSLIFALTEDEAGDTRNDMQL